MAWPVESVPTLMSTCIRGKMRGRGGGGGEGGEKGLESIYILLVLPLIVIFILLYRNKCNIIILLFHV